jgi:putative acetyltransferase
MALIEPVEFVSKKGQKIQIRSALISEALDVLNTMIEIAEDSPYILSSADDFRKKTEAEEAAFIEKSINGKHSFFLVVIVDQKIIGTADFSNYRDSKRAHRGGLGISIHKAYRGEGIGKKVMEVIIDNARAFHSIEYIELDVMEENKAAFQMYKGLGFEVVHRTPQAYQLSEGNYTSNIMMRLENKK